MAETSDRFTVCTIQPAITWGDPPRTFEHIVALLDRASQESAVDLVVLPEHFNATRELPGQSLQFDRALTFARQLARRFQINLVAGSVERWDEACRGRVNTALVLNRHGLEVGRYNKRKLWNFERQHEVQPGQQALTVRLDDVRCGVLICADLWYPELVREQLDLADILCVPAQTTIRPESEPAYARLLWHSLAMVRAQENVMALVVSDHAATSQAHYQCGGVSSITDPSAEPDRIAIQQVLVQGQEGFLLHTVDLARLSAFRAYRRRSGLLP